MRWLALGFVALLGASGGGRGGAPRARQSGPGPDTLTVAYDVAGLHVIQRVNRATDIVAARLYLLGGTRQLTEGTAGIEAIFLNASSYGTARYPGDEARRAMARTGSVVQLEVGVQRNWAVMVYALLLRTSSTATDIRSRWSRVLSMPGRKNWKIPFAP